jgi:flagellar M-ring protein FliF
MLDEVLGPDKSVVRVTAQLNFQQLERTSEIYDPNAPSIRSEQRTRTAGSSTDRGQEEAESSEEDSQETTITNYELNKTVDHIINAVGTLDRLSVAVLVDGKYSEVETNGVTETIYEPRSPEELDRLEAIVKNAVGYDAERNDQVEMLNIAFDRKNIETDREALDGMYLREFYLDIAKKVGYVLLAVFLFLYLKKKSKKLFGALAKLVPPPAPRPAPVQQAVEAEPEPEPEIQPEKRQPRLVDKMQETAKKEPEEIAKVIKTMMIE